MMQFPTIPARNLHGRAVTLPAELEGEQRILLIAFQRWQQNLIDSWVPFLEELEAARPEARYYELPIIRELPGLVQNFIDEGMRAGIPDPATRERTLTAYVDKTTFREALDLPHEDTIYVLLLDGGEVRWRAGGAYTADKGRSLVATMEGDR
jgi:hypothetical protein